MRQLTSAEIESIMNNKYNGNYTDYNEQLRKLSKYQLITFIINALEMFDISPIVLLADIENALTR